MQTKMSILQKQLGDLHDAAVEAQRAYADAVAHIEGLEATFCGLRCSGCDTLLKTEADFARHFEIPDSRYLNLGECPNNPRKRY